MLADNFKQPAPPKTKAGKRTTPLTAAMLDMLDRQRKDHKVNRSAAGPARMGGTPGVGNTPVFAALVGTVYGRKNPAQTLRASLEKAGPFSRGLHALQLTFATNRVRSGADLRTLAKILGNTNVAFTMQQLVHSDMTTKRAGMSAVDRGLKRAKKTPVRVKVRVKPEKVA